MNLCAPIYVSPHCDDICFSLGGSLIPGSPGLLLTLFDVSIHSVVPIAREKITVARRKEDGRFADAMGWRRIGLALPEPRVRGRSPFSTPTEEERKVIESVMSSVVKSILKRADPGGRIWFPLGIGAHLDHLLISDYVLIHLLDEVEWRRRICLYEELPYASNSRSRQNRLANVEPQLNKAKFSRTLAPIDPNQKKAVLRLYPSQLGRKNVDLGTFAVADADRRGLCEAWWSYVEA